MHPTPTNPVAAVASTRSRLAPTPRRKTWVWSLALHAILLGVLWFVNRAPEQVAPPAMMTATWSPIVEHAAPEPLEEELLTIEEPEFDLPDVTPEEPVEQSLDEVHELVDPESEPVVVADANSIVVLSSDVFRPKLRPAPVVPHARAPTPVRRPAVRPKRRGGSLTLVTQPSVSQFYPAEARRQNLEGEAIVLIRVDVTGRVVHASVRRSTGYLILDDAALLVAYAHVFSPGIVGRAELPIRFRLIG